MRGNTVSIKGNLTREPDWRFNQGPSNRTLAAFNIAWNSRRMVAPGEFEDVAHYFEVNCWMSQRQGEYLKPLLVKGASCSIIDGTLTYYSWQGPDGNRSKVYISVTDPIGGMQVSLPQKVLAAQAAHRMNVQHEQMYGTADDGSLADDGLSIETPAQVPSPASTPAASEPPVPDPGAYDEPIGY